MMTSGERLQNRGKGRSKRGLHRLHPRARAKLRGFRLAGATGAALAEQRTLVASASANGTRFSQSLKRLESFARDHKRKTHVHSAKFDWMEEYGRLARDAKRLEQEMVSGFERMDAARSTPRLAIGLDRERQKRQAADFELLSAPLRSQTERPQPSRYS